MKKIERGFGEPFGNKETLQENFLLNTNSDRKKQLTVRLEPYQYRLVRLLEKQMGISQAKAVRKLVEKGIGEID